MISVFPVFYWGIYKPVIPAHGLITNLPKSAEYAIFCIGYADNGQPQGLSLRDIRAIVIAEYSI